MAALSWTVPLLQSLSRGELGAMTDYLVPDDTAPDLAHQLVDRMTVMKLRIGTIRLQLQKGSLAIEDIDDVLAQVEEDIDAAGLLAQTIREARSPQSS